MRERVRPRGLRVGRLSSPARAARPLGSEWDLLAVTLRERPLAGLLLLLTGAPFWAVRDVIAFALREVIVSDGRRRASIRWSHPAAPLVALAVWAVALLGLIFVAPALRAARLWRRFARRGD